MWSETRRLGIHVIGESLNTRVSNIWPRAVMASTAGETNGGRTAKRRHLGNDNQAGDRPALLDLPTFRPLFKTCDTIALTGSKTAQSSSLLLLKLNDDGRSRQARSQITRMVRHLPLSPSRRYDRLLFQQSYVQGCS